MNFIKKMLLLKSHHLLIFNNYKMEIGYTHQS